MPIPCVTGNNDGLSVFQATADQRYLLGKDLFLRTHLPVRFWLQHAGRSHTWTEQQLLDAVLQSPEAQRGNRVFMLFGAAGAGKSEVMRWLMLRLADCEPKRSRFCLRIARTDLDPIRIVNRVLETFGDSGLGETTMNRWEELKQKPVALANHVVWKALAGMYNSDEEILPLSYRLRPVVEANLRSGFAAMEDATSSRPPLQLLSREQLEQVLGDTVLDLDPVYEHLRSHLQAAFDESILGPVQVVPMLRRLSRRIRDEHGVRPMLIVDDLVQSMNVYATDLLDYLITLEEGEWDVIMGLTPAAFEWDRRGRELLLRIRELDTVDDRVVKLDLSDPTGDTSAFLDETTAPDFLAAYLTVYKEQAGYTCGQGCPHWSTCLGLQWGQRDDALLSPLNPAVVQRLWRKLPRGKGRARHLLLAARNALAAIADQGVGALPALTDLIERDTFVDHPDSRVRSVMELYHPGGAGDIEPIPLAISQVWELDGQRSAAVHQLRTPQGAEGPVSATVDKSPATDQDPVRAAVRDWLEGGTPNGELLKPLRHAVARFLREVVDPGLLAGIGHAQPNGALRWCEVQHGVNLSLRVAGIDDGPGIMIHRELGSRCFDLLDYAEAKGSGRLQLAGRLASDVTVAQLIFEAKEQQMIWRDELASRLDCNITEFAFHTFRVALALGAALPIPAVFAAEADVVLPGAEWPKALVQGIRQLWEDCFRVRDHLYDGYLLDRDLKRWPKPSDSLNVLERILDVVVPDSFRLNERPLTEFLVAVRNHLGLIRDRLSREDALWPERVTLGQTCAKFLDGRSRAGLNRRWTSFATAVGEDYPLSPFPGVPSSEDTTLVADLRGDLDRAVGNRDVVHAYRVATKWARAQRLTWFLEVSRWQTNVLTVCRTMGVTPNHVAVLEQGPTDVGDLMRGATAMALECRRKQKASAAVDGIRSILDDPAWTECRRLNMLLELLAPEEFAIGMQLAAARHFGSQLQSQFARAQAWLDGPGSSLEPPTLPRPGAVDIKFLDRAVQEAATWWAWYITQSDALVLPQLPSGGELKFFVMEVLSGQLSTGERQTAWEQFLAQVRAHGPFDLPVVAFLSRTDVPPEARELVQSLIVDGGPTVTLNDLPIQTLALVQQLVPQLAQTIQLRVTPEGVHHGILRLVD